MLCLDGEEEGAACNRERRELLILDTMSTRERNVAFKNMEAEVCLTETNNGLMLGHLFAA